MKNLILIVLGICLLLMVACQTQDINTPKSAPQTEALPASELKETSSQEQSTASKPQENVDKTPAPSICIETNDIISKNMNSSVATVPEMEYQGSKLEHLYAADTKKYVMAEITDHSQIAEILKGFEGRSTEQANANGYAYLLFNGDGKQYQYLQDNDKEIALTKNCLAALASSKLHPSWLIHFDPEKIVDVNGMTDKTKISALSSFLKNEVTTGAATEVLDAPVNPNVAMGDFFIKIKFSSDVQYTILGTDYFDGTGNICIYTSDLNKTIGYTLDKGVAQKITAFLKDFMPN